MASNEYAKADNNELVMFIDGDFEYEATDINYTASVVRLVSVKSEVTVPNTATDPNTGNTFEVTKIDDGAFVDHQELEILHFEKGSGITFIGEMAFDGCNKLKTVDWHNLENLATIDKEAFSGCSSLTGEIFFHSSITFIWDAAFANCSQITSLVFDEDADLESIMNEAFYNCSGIKGEVKFPQGLGYVGPSAFYNCSKITSLSFEKCDGLRTIDSFAFMGCSSLKDICFAEMYDFEVISSNAFGIGQPGSEYEYEFMNYINGEKFNLPYVDHSVFEGSKYHRDSTDGRIPFTRTCDVSIEGIGDSTVYAGTKLSEPQLADRPSYVFNGWYWNNLYWSFEKYVVIDDMTLTQKWSPIEEGTVMINSRNSTTVEINLDGKQVDTVMIDFPNGNSITLYTSSSNDKIFISMYELSGNKVEIITEGYDGTITVSLSVNYYKGTPNAYYYGDDGKVLMDSIMTMDGHIVFDTDHNSTYGVEYEKTANEGMSYGPILLLWR